MTKSLKYYDIILATFAAVLLVSNISAVKLISFGPIIIDGGAVLFPLAYLLGDILTEVYGYSYSRRAIWLAFSILFMSIVVFTIVRFLPAASEYTDQSAFESILGFFPRIVLASLLAFLIGSFVNSYILAKIKIKTNGRYLWLRLISSTLIGQLLDTVVFALVAFGGILIFKDMVIFILVGWIFKTVVEIVLLPVTYRLIRYIKKAENIDNYDTKTNFNPFRFNLQR